MKLQLSLGGLAAGQLALTVLIQVVVFRTVGVGAMTDAYVAAQTVPLLIVAVFASPMQQLWQPRLAVAAEDATRLNSESALAQGHMLVLIASVGALLAVLAPLWLPLMFPGLNREVRPLALQMNGIFVAAAICNAQSLLLTSAHRAQGRFVLPEAVGAVASAAVLLACYWAIPIGGVAGAAWLTLSRAVAVMAVLWLVGRYPLPNVGAVLRGQAPWRALRPLLAGASLYKTSPLVDRYWSSLAPNGGMTVFNLAQMGIGALAQILERSLCMPNQPRIARLAKAGERGQLWTLCRSTMVRVTVVTLVFAGMLVLAQPVWSTLMESTLRLDGTSADLMWWVCLTLVGYLHVSAVGSQPVAAFVAMGDSRTPVIVSSIAFVLGMAGKSAAFLVGGLPAMALATSLYYVGNLLVISHLLKRRLHVPAA